MCKLNALNKLTCPIGKRLSAHSLVGGAELGARFVSQVEESVEVFELQEHTKPCRGMPNASRLAARVAACPDDGRDYPSLVIER